VVEEIAVGVDAKNEYCARVGGNLDIVVGCGLLGSSDSVGRNGKGVGFLDSLLGGHGFEYSSECGVPVQ